MLTKVIVVVLLNVYENFQAYFKCRYWTNVLRRFITVSSPAATLYFYQRRLSCTLALFSGHWHMDIRVQ